MGRREIQIVDRTFVVEWGEVAQQADGAVLVRENETVLLVTAVSSSEPRSGVDFFPLTVDYRERFSAVGRFPGGYRKREGQAGVGEVLTSRLVDRSIRPLFPDRFRCETQLLASVLSFDPDGDPAILAILGASAALQLSGIPWDGPVAPIRIGRSREGGWIANPSAEERASSAIDLIVASARDGLVMVEGGAREVPEEEVLAALRFAEETSRPILAALEELREEGRAKRAVVAPPEEALRAAFEDLVRRTVRSEILGSGRRADGRGLSEVRPIEARVGWLPRVHGSALFTRGETQALTVCTLGTGKDEQEIERLTGTDRETFQLYYRFPPYSVGEARPMRAPGRREIGHGTLARRALEPVLPSQERFAYTIKIESEITSSNGSSSMATVCGGSLALMDAGVPIERPVAGIAMGLIREGDRSAILSDILGDEDHLGDMDFKVAGTEGGMTAIQLDNKVGALPFDLLAAAVEQARQGRLHILGEMARALPKPRPHLSPLAPRVKILKIGVHRIRSLIGPGGRVIQALQAEADAKIDVGEDGTVRIFAANTASLDLAERGVRDRTGEPEAGRFYRGTVAAVKDFGIFVRLFEGIDGLVHISELAEGRVSDPSRLASAGDEMIVQVLGVDDQGKIQLSRKKALGVRKEEIENP